MMIGILNNNLSEETKIQIRNKVYEASEIYNIYGDYQDAFMLILLDEINKNKGEIEQQKEEIEYLKQRITELDTEIIEKLHEGNKKIADLIYESRQLKQIIRREIKELKQEKEFYEKYL